jgi:cytochrome c oxidase assembly protein subunit 11
MSVVLKLDQTRKNQRVGLLAITFACGMVGMAYAAVPLYKIFCEATGFAGTPARALEKSQVVSNSKVMIRFDANTDSALPWRFSPVMAQATIKIGQNAMAFYTAENMSDKPIVGTAKFNVSPDIAAQYFTKVQCFCFVEQVLQPGEKMTMPVSYFVDPRILDDKVAKNIKEITLSYTFFRAGDEAAQLANPANKTHSGAVASLPADTKVR